MSPARVVILRSHFPYKERSIFPDEMKNFVTKHFDDLINKGDIGAVERNVSSDYVDHKGPGGRKTGIDESRERTMRSIANRQDLKGEVRDVLVDADKIVVRNVWTAIDQERPARIQMRGFVLSKINEGKLAERRATISEPEILKRESFDW